MALAPVRLALAALPVMRQQQHGRIVTIASIGGKSACRTCCLTAPPSSRPWDSPKACGPSSAAAR
jgi:hypothetical protein